MSSNKWLTRSSLGGMCYLGELANVREAIGRGEDVNDKTQHGTGLMLAVEKNHYSIVRLLLEQPTLDLNCTDGRTDRGWTALHIAASSDNVEGVQLLLADPRLNTHNHIGNDDWTPVMTAMYMENINTLRELVAHPSVDLDTRDTMGQSLEDSAR